VWFLSLGAVTGWILGGVCVLFFGVAGVHQVRLLVNRRPAIVIDGKGLTDNTLALSVSFLPWAEVTSFRSGGRWVVVEVADIQTVRARISPARRLMLLANRAFDRGGALYVTPGTSPISVDDLIREIDLLAPQHVRRPWE
jgi:hypothetical protein